MSIKIVQHLDQTQWRDFVDKHPQGNVFHTPEMFQMFAQTKGHRPTLWAALDNGEVLALLLPVQITLRDGLLQRLTTRAVTYGSVLYKPDSTGRKALAFLLRTYARERGREALFTELRNLSDLGAVQPVLKDCGFVYEDHLNYLVDLNRPSEDIMQRISKRTRKKIRRQLRQNKVIVEEVTQREQLAAWHAVVQETYNRDRAYGSFYPNELLTWHILEWGAKHGYKVYDFGGAGKPDEEYGVRDFKAKFGGELVCYGRNTCVHAPFLLHLSKLGYKIHRQLI
jgi:lipid II:glycine glycyltransferase (peptidoglycan interpeptide bridge formation enzyme)